MKKYKKFLAVILALLMLLTASGCSENGYHIVSDADNCITQPQTVTVDDSQVTLLEYYMYPDFKVFTYEPHPGKARDDEDFKGAIARLDIGLEEKKESVSSITWQMPRKKTVTIIQGNGRYNYSDNPKECDLTMDFFFHDKLASGKFKLDNFHYSTMKEKDIKGEIKIGQWGTLILDKISVAHHVLVLSYRAALMGDSDFHIYPDLQGAFGELVAPLRGGALYSREDIEQEMKLLFPIEEEPREGQKYNLAMTISDGEWKEVDKVNFEFEY